jgi:peptidoglycan/xylan/chitin deacetylase (PgdA/CDA1 family)
MAGAAALAGCGSVAGHDAAASSSSATRRDAAATTTTPPPSTAPPTTTVPLGPAAYVAHGPRSSRGVALTFHGSGDVTLAQDLLSEAHRLSTPITVFGVGTWMQDNPAVAHDILAAGHTLGNHTYTHPDLGTLDAAAVAQEIRGCAAVLEGIEGDNGRWFRPSGVVVPSSLILDQAGLAGYPVSVGYDIDPLDYEDPGASVLVSRVAEGLLPGSIVSLHTGHAGTVEAMPGMVGAIRARHLEPVLVGTLLQVGSG